MRNQKLYLAAVLCMCAAGATSAAPPKKTKTIDSSLSASVDFTNLTNSQYDGAFNRENFTEQVRAALSRSGISVDSVNRGNYHLNFETTYVYLPGETDYRFVTFFASVNNKENHAICYSKRSAWWGGPSGARYVVNTSQNAIDFFLKSCLSIGQ